MQHLTEEELVAVNALVVKKTGGSIGLRDAGLLSSIVQKPQTNFAGEDMYPDVFLKAAVIYEAIVNYHVFVDGNKRTAFAAMARFLSVNGYKFQAEFKEAEDYTVFIATHNPDLADISSWIKQHSRKDKS